MNWDFDGSFRQKPVEDSPPGYVPENHSKIDILISTPGRLVDHIKSTEGFGLNDVQWLIIDEADRLLEDSFQQWIEIIVPALEYQRPRDLLEDQMLRIFHLLDERIVKKVILSATMTRDLGKLHGLNLRRPKLVVLQNTPADIMQAKDMSDVRQMTDEEQKAQLPPTLLEYAVQIRDEEEKPLYLLEMLRNNKYSLAAQQNREKADTPNQASDVEIESDSSLEKLSTTSSPISTSSDRSSVSSGSNEDLQPPRNDEDRTLVFTSSSSSAHRLSRLLQLLDANLGSRVTTLTTASSSSTKKLLRSLPIRSTATARSQIIIISTDRASRGLDIPNLTQVINYDMPSSIKNYVHRVGRTARAGRYGKATTLIGWTEGRWFWNEIAKGYKIGRGKDMKVRRIQLRSEGWNESERNDNPASTTVTPGYLKIAIAAVLDDRSISHHELRSGAQSRRNGEDMRNPTTARHVVGKPTNQTTKFATLIANRRSFHDYFVTHLPSSSLHPDSGSSRGPHHKLPRSASKPHDASSAGGPSPTPFPGPNRDTTVVRIPIRSAKHHFGASVSRGQRPYNEDTFQAGVIELPAFAKRAPINLTRAPASSPLQAYREEQRKKQEKQSTGEADGE
ncbi:MAG: hypothetical protein Q9214_006792, partial [Letrouitia sp. 1 TL-2023]